MRESASSEFEKSIPSSGETPAVSGIREKKEHVAMSEDHEKELRLVERMREAGRALSEAVIRAHPEREAIERTYQQVEKELAGEVTQLSEIADPNDPNAPKNRPLRVRLESGREAVYKPRVREMSGLRIGIPDGGFANREWIAFQINRALGFDVVPPTILRDGPEGVGSVQAWQKGRSATVAPEWKEEKYKDAVERIALFDAVTRNTDRNAENFLVADNDTSPESGIVGYDHGTILSQNVMDDVLRSTLLMPKKFGGLGGEPVSPEGRALLTSFLAASDVQAALKQAFAVAFDDEHASEMLWEIFIDDIQQYARQNGRLPLSRSAA